MMSLRPRFHAPTNRTTRWIVAGVCAATLTTGLIVADADLASLQDERSEVAAEVAAQTAAIAELETLDAALRAQLQEVRDAITTSESALSSTTGMLP